MARSSVFRLGAEYRQRLEAALADGATIDEIADELNTALRDAGREERVSRSAVGRAAVAAHPILERKRQIDAVLAQLRGAGDGDSRAERLDLMRTLVVDAAATGEGLTPTEIRDLCSAFVNIERAEHLAERRAAAVEQRGRDARAAGRAARREGVSPAVEAAIREAIEGA